MPVIEGWILQWYEKVPALVNVKEYDEPEDRSGDVHDTASPESELQVCVVESLLVTVTFAPRFTFNVAGEKEKLSMVRADPDVPPAVEPPAAAVGAVAAFDL